MSPARYLDTGGGDSRYRGGVDGHWRSLVSVSVRLCLCLRLCMVKLRSIWRRLGGVLEVSRRWSGGFLGRLGEVV